MNPTPAPRAPAKLPKGISRLPKKAHVTSGHEAWWYDGKRTIQVLIQPTSTTNAVSCTIKRSELLKYISRSAQ